MTSQYVSVLVYAVRVLFFFNDTATTEIYTLSLHDALPISSPLPSLSVKPASESLSDDDAKTSLLAEIRVACWLGKFDEAFAAVDRRLTQHPNEPMFLEEKGDVLGKRGKFKEAAAAYEAALDALPTPQKSPTMEAPEGLIHKLDMA